MFLPSKPITVSLGMLRGDLKQPVTATANAQAVKIARKRMVFMT